MSSASLEAQIQAAAQVLRGARRLVVLTGAGISVESGIPDFRSQSGIWTRFDPMEYATRWAFEADPARCWQLFQALGELCSDASPNPAHDALARWGEDLESMTIVTQNIDGLHQAAGSEEVIEFHGSARSGHCPRCNATEADLASRSEWPPTCACGAILKPDVVLFGDPIPAGAWGQSVQCLEACDGVLVIGTSAQVAPFSELPRLAAAAGRPIIEINVERTELSSLPTTFIQGKAGEMVPELLDAVTRQGGHA